MPPSTTMPDLTSALKVGGACVRGLVEGRAWEGATTPGQAVTFYCSGLMFSLFPFFYLYYFLTAVCVGVLG